MPLRVLCWTFAVGWYVDVDVEGPAPAVAAGGPVYGGGASVGMFDMLWLFLCDAEMRRKEGGGVDVDARVET